MQRRVRFALVAFFVAVASFAAVSNPSWDALVAGNERYVKGRLKYFRLVKQRNDHRDHQSPPVTVVSCSDSRVPPELIFDKSIGDVFVVRVAGNVLDDVNLGTIDYAVLRGYTKTIVVMGHEKCGAVDAALGPNDPVWTPQLLTLVDLARRNLGIAPGDGKPRPPLHDAIVKNALAVSGQLKQHFAAMNPPRVVPIVTAYYDFDGHVTKIEK